MKSTFGEINDWFKGIKLGHSSKDKLILFTFIINAVIVIIFLVTFFGKEKTAGIVLTKPNLLNWIPAKKVLVKIDGILLSLPVTLDCMIIVKSDWEKEEREFALNLPFDSGFILDLGANVGHYTALLATKYPKSKVFSVEASPTIFPILKSNCKLNNLSNLVLYNRAISDKDDITIEIFEKDSLSTIHKQFLNGLHIPTEKIRREKVRTLTIDSLIESENLDPVILLKMDIEGAEVEGLKGASSALRKKTIKNLIIEYHSIGNRTYITNLLKDLGYSYSVHERSIFFETKEFANGHILATLDDRNNQE